MNYAHLPHRILVNGAQRAQLSNALAAYAFAQHLDGDVKVEPVHCARSSHLTGHHADGGGVQAHSAGDVYPFIVFSREGDEFGQRWCVWGPGIEGELNFASFTAAYGAAQRCKAVSSIEDAWAFELEALCHVAQQKQAAMVAAAGVWNGPDAKRLNCNKWLAMSKAERVASLLALGRVRNTLRLPMIQPPLFAAYARATR